MASPMTATLKKDKKDESFFEKIGTITRKKKAKEAEELVQEGKLAIESPSSPMAPDLGPEFYLLEESEERSMIEPMSRETPKLCQLMKMLLDWINDELAENRIIVQNLEEDLFDGQILQKLIGGDMAETTIYEKEMWTTWSLEVHNKNILLNHPLNVKLALILKEMFTTRSLQTTEKLASVKVEAPEVTQSEVGQKQKLRVVLDMVSKILQLPPSWNQHKWNVDSIHSKNLVAILHLLVALARYFRAPIRLPENVSVNVVVVQKRDGLLQTRRIAEEITGLHDDIGGRFERDAFDTLFDHAPDKLNVVKKSLIMFVNKHLNKINLEVTDLDVQFHDGVYLVLLMGLLEGYFVPLYCFHLTPTSFEQKVHNVQFAFELMQDSGLPKPKARPEDVVNLDLKSTLRVLYNLFTKYKYIS